MVCQTVPRPWRRILTCFIAARRAAEEAAYIKAHPVPGTTESMELRLSLFTPAKDNFVVIMNLMCKWKGAQVGPVPIEMLQQAVKRITIYKREQSLLMDELLVQMERDIGLGKKIMLEKSDWEKARYTEMKNAHEDKLNGTKINDEKTDDEKS